MSKKLIAACLALAAFAAFAVMPALASAKPVLTTPTGTVKATGSAIQATNVGETEMKTSLGTLKCTTATLSGTLTTNSTASGSEGEITSATFAGTGPAATGEPDNECTGGFGNASITPNVSSTAPWCLEATESTDTFKIRGGKCTEATRATKFILTLTAPFIGTVTCNYERTTAAGGTLETDISGQQAAGTMSNQVWTGISNPSGCPSSGELTMTFKLESSTGEPMYFSS